VSIRVALGCQAGPLFFSKGYLATNNYSKVNREQESPARQPQYIRRRARSKFLLKSPSWRRTFFHKGMRLHQYRGELKAQFVWKQQKGVAAGKLPSSKKLRKKANWKTYIFVWVGNDLAEKTKTGEKKDLAPITGRGGAGKTARRVLGRGSAALRNVDIRS